MGGEGIAGMGRSGACRYNRMRTLSKSDTPFMYIDYIKETITNRVASRRM